MIFELVGEEMNRKIRILSVICICWFMFSMTVYANSRKEMDFISVGLSNDESVLLPKGARESSGMDGSSRGDYISSSYLNISNKGYGEIGILAMTLAHKPVKKIRMNVYLDRWDEEKETWFQVDYYYFTYEYKEGEEDLTEVTEDFSVLGLPTGCYYRLRSFNAVFPFEGGVESQGPVTDGVLITDGPAV